VVSSAPECAQKQMMYWKAVLLARYAVATTINSRNVHETHLNDEAGTGGVWAPNFNDILRLEKDHPHGTHGAFLQEGPTVSKPLFRHAVNPSPNMVWIGELFAILVTIVLVLFATQLQVSQYLALRKRQTDKALKLAYPWRCLPSAVDIMEIGPTYATNFQSGLKQSFAARGLSPEADRIALMSFLIPAEAAGKKQPRALIERHNRVPAGCLGGKRALAKHLKDIKLDTLAPMTFLSPLALRKALEPRVKFVGFVQGIVSDARAEGLWFLKHSTMDRNEGVSCFKGVRNLLAHWDKMSRSQRVLYVAQAEVPRPMLMDGRKMMVRAYVITLPGGRCFMHRELLLKGHPQPYDPSDADPLRHVVSCVKYDGVISGRGTEWPHYEKVWPKISKMMTAILGPSAVGNGRLPFTLRDDTMLDLVCHRIQDRFQDIYSWLRWGRKAGALLYNLFGVDIIVDQDLRPWLIELNPGPAMGIDQRDPLATQLRADVMEDLCRLLLDPLLRTVQVSQKNEEQRARLFAEFLILFEKE
ncbi:unnamed protein product, partial [Durusdinium trenchii]